MKAVIVYGPHPRVKLLPVVIAVCLGMAAATFAVAYFNVNGLREPAGYLPACAFVGFALVFLALYWRRLVRVTLDEQGVVIERLFPFVTRVAYVPYGEIRAIEQARLSLKLVLRAQDGRALCVLPDLIVKVEGELSAVGESSIPANAEGLLLDIYQLRQEVAHRAGLIK